MLTPLVHKLLQRKVPHLPKIASMRLVHMVSKPLKDIMGKKYLKLNLLIITDVKILNKLFNQISQFIHRREYISAI